MLGKLLLAAAMTKTGREILIHLYKTVGRPMALDIRDQIQNRKDYNR